MGVGCSDLWALSCPVCGECSCPIWPHGVRVPSLNNGCPLHSLVGVGQYHNRRREVTTDA